MRLTRSQNIGLLATVLLGVVASVVLRFTNDELWKELQSLPLSYLLVPFGSYVIIYGVDALRLKFMLSPYDFKLSLNERIKNGVLGSLFSNITPMAAGGQPFQIYHLKNRGVPGGTAAALIMLRFMEYMLLSLLVTLWGCLVYRDSLLNIASMLTGGMVMLILGISLFLTVTVLMITLFLNPRGTSLFLLSLCLLLRKTPWRDRVIQGLGQAKTTLLQFRRSRKILVTTDFILGIINLLLQSWSLYFLLTAVLPLGNGLSFLQVFTGFVLLNTVAYFIPTPGGSGGIEGLYTIFFSGLAGSSLGAAVLFWRFGSYYLHFPLQIITLLLSRKDIES